MKADALVHRIVFIVVIAVAAPLWAQEEQPAAEPAAAEQAAAEEAAPAEDVAAPEQPAAEPAAASTEFETTVDFTLAGPIALDAVVGEVEVRSIEFVRADVKSGMIKGAFGSDNEDLKANLTVRLSCATTAAKKWKIDVVVEFLDAEGTTIDRASNSISTKNEAKIFDFKLTTLAWVVPHIAKAKVSISGKQ